MGSPGTPSPPCLPSWSRTHLPPTALPADPRAVPLLPLWARRADSVSRRQPFLWTAPAVHHASAARQRAPPGGGNATDKDAVRGPWTRRAVGLPLGAPRRFPVGRALQPPTSRSTVGLEGEGKGRGYGRPTAGQRTAAPRPRSAARPRSFSFLSSPSAADPPSRPFPLCPPTCCPCALGRAVAPGGTVLVPASYGGTYGVHVYVRRARARRRLPCLPAAPRGVRTVAFSALCRVRPAGRPRTTASKSAYADAASRRRPSTRRAPVVCRGRPRASCRRSVRGPTAEPRGPDSARRMRTAQALVPQRRNQRAYGACTAQPASLLYGACTAYKHIYAVLRRIPSYVVLRQSIPAPSAAAG